MGSTFGVNVPAVENMIISAKEELGKIEHLLRGTLEEIAYLESEKQAVESFVKFHELQSERREVFKKVFPLIGIMGSH